MLRVLVISLFTFWCLNLNAQEENGIKKTHLIGLGMGLHNTGADMADRFGGGKSVNLFWEIMAPSRIFMGIEGGVLFGGQVNEPNLGINLINENGSVTGASGFPATVDPTFFGYKIQFNLGKTWQFGESPSWMWVGKFGLGFLEHKIDFDIANEDVPQLSGEYVKGYDRLTNGILTEFYFGLMHLDQNRLKNFYVGVHASPAFTGERRAFNFDTQTLPIENRFDFLYGIKAGWVLPIYRSVKDVYYYN